MEDEEDVNLFVILTFVFLDFSTFLCFGTFVGHITYWYVYTR